VDTKRVTFRKPGDKFELPDLPDFFLNKANKVYTYLNGPDNLGAKLEAVYRLLDEMAPFIATFATCSKGCAHCCHFDVQLTTFEAEYIYMKTGVSFTNEGGITTGHAKPCPFLKRNAECGIYASRPLLCRTYHVLGDPGLCVDPTGEQIQYGSEACDFGNGIYKQLVGWVHFQTANVEGGKLRDIRDFFPHSRNDVQTHLFGKG
jgi:Fe-S-cluster containining protein